MQDATAEDELAEASGSALLLPAVLDLKAAALLAAAFLSRRGGEVVVDAGSVQRLGGQCLQVLLSARLSWAEDSQPMLIENASPEFCAAVELFGAQEALSFSLKEPA